MNNYSEVTVDVDLLRAKTALVMSIAEDLKESVGGSFPMAVDKTMRSLQTRFLYFQSVFQEHGSVDALVKSASSIAMNGSKICNGLANTVLRSDDSVLIREKLREASEDLGRYCQAHTPPEAKDVSKSASFSLHDAGRSLFDLTRQSAQLQAQSEKVSRSITGMEKRVEAIGQTADAAVARVEELTVQQAEAMRAALNREVADITNGFASTNQALKDQLEEFDGYRAKAVNLLGQLSTAVLAGGHIKSAQVEETAADNYRGWALAAMGLGVLTIGAMLFFTGDQAFTWAGLANRAIVAFLFVVPTAYLTRESAKHRAQAIELRRASLDFAALDPFLQNMQGEEGQKVRAELARRAFFTGNAFDSSSSYGLDPQALILKAMDIAADAVKKK